MSSIICDRCSVCVRFPFGWLADGTFSRTDFTLGKDKLDQCPANDLQFIKENSLAIVRRSCRNPRDNPTPLQGEILSFKFFAFAWPAHRQKRLKGVAWVSGRNRDLQWIGIGPGSVVGLGLRVGVNHYGAYLAGPIFIVDPRQIFLFQANLLLYDVGRITTKGVVNNH